MSGVAGMTLALTANAFIQNPVAAHREPGFLKLVELLRATDMAIANIECVIQDGENWPAFWPGMAWEGTQLTCMSAPPSMVEDLKFMGIKAVTAANNHIGDFGEGGILSTIANLKRGGLPVAGIGASLTEASQPCYVETAHGRVGLIAAVDWGPKKQMEIPAPWPAGYMPSDEFPPFKSRPGINLLRYAPVFQVNRDAFDQLRAISQAFGWQKGKARRRLGADRGVPLMGTMLGWEQDTDTEFFFMGRKFVLGESFAMSTVPYEEDLDRIYRQIREARRQADVVVVALHDQSHGEYHDYASIFAHGAIDAGADIYFSNGGAHKGIELYQGKMILYGQSSLYLQNDQVRKVPAAMMRRVGLGPDATASEFLRARGEGREGEEPEFSAAGSMIHRIELDAQANVREITVHPVWYGAAFAAGNPKGVPQLAEPGSEVFNKVVKRTVERSKPFGTRVEILDDRALVRVEQ
jgi:poly-gamma-glutamate capsule biosynthesis protein CapA/YwtB (metallophosphatase superfamily)